MYIKQNFQDGDLLTAEHLNHIEDGIIENTEKDWDINDEAQGGFIKNRPIYKNNYYEILHDGTSNGAIGGNQQEGISFTYGNNLQLDFINGEKYRITIINDYIYEGIADDEKIIYTVDNITYYAYKNFIKVPYFIAQLCSSTNRLSNLKIEHIAEGIMVEKDYLNAMQSDYNIEDENDSRYIANKPVKEDYGYRTLMKDATFEYEKLSSYHADGFINGYCLLDSNDVIGDQFFTICYDNGVNQYSFDGYSEENARIRVNDREITGNTGSSSTGEGLLKILSDVSFYVCIPQSIYEERNGDIKVSVYQKSEANDILVRSNNIPVSAPLVLDSSVTTYEHLPFVGDEALDAILNGRQILVKVPNANNETIYANYMPVIQYQLPNVNNDFLTLIYLKDGLANNLVTALGAMMQGGQPDFSAVYGELNLKLSKTYTSSPLK